MELQDAELLAEAKLTFYKTRHTKQPLSHTSCRTLFNGFTLTYNTVLYPNGNIQAQKHTKRPQREEKCPKTQESEPETKRTLREVKMKY